MRSHGPFPIALLFVLLVCLRAPALLAAVAADDLARLGAHATRGAAAGYVEDSVCGTCHVEKYASYQHVGMAQSLRRPEHARPMERFGEEYHHAPSQRYYRIDRTDSGLVFHRYQRDAAGAVVNAVDIPIAWVLGSGNRARSYLYQTEWGELYLLPLGWYSETASWGMSPGFEYPDHPGIHRRIERECMFCHNGFPEVPSGSDLHGMPATFPAVLPEGTGCQRCHGPGAAHLQAVLDGAPADAIRGAIVNPVRLTPQRRDSVCFQCHMLPVVSVVGARRFGRGDYSFRPGELISDYLVHVDVQERGEDPAERFEINHHGYRLFQSRCYRESVGELACTSCHDPHVKPEPVAFRARVAEVCGSCHAEPSGQHPAQLDLGDGDCVRCHMPRRRTRDVIHVTMTDHRIARGPFDLEALAAPLEPEVPLVTGVDLLEFGQPPTGAEATAYRTIPALRAGRSMQAALIALQRSLEQHSYTEPTPYLDLARGQLQTGRFAEAEATARRVLASNDGLAVAHTLLGVALMAQNRSADAISELQRSLALQRDPETHFNLALAYLRAGAADEGEAQLTAALELRPLMAVAWKYRGLLRAARGDRPGARDALIRAIALDPLDTAAYAQLIDVLRALGESQQAERYLELGRRVSGNPSALQAPPA
ncbi:MAG: cytochrome c3 family protein [Pseudomonadales bacterium]